MAAVGAGPSTQGVAARLCTGENQTFEAKSQLSSTLVPASPSLAFSHSISQSPILVPSRPSQASRQHNSLRVEAAKGTQFFRLGQNDGQGQGTTILRGKKKGDGTQKLVQRNRGGTRKLTFLSKPEEVSAAPAGLLGGLVLPFANLFKSRSADPKTVFVAGATGQTGSRLVVELLSAGFSVRAGVDVAKDAEVTLEALAAEYRGIIGGDKAKRLSFVQFSSSDAQFTSKAIDTAGKLVVALGPQEAGPKASTTPQMALVLLEAAEAAKVPYFVLVAPIAEGGNSNGGSSNNGGLFGAIFGFLSTLVKGGASYSDLVNAILDSSLRFSIVRTGKTAGVPDSFDEQSNIVIVPEGKISAGSISSLQVAKVVSELLGNVAVAQNKVFDVIATSDAPAVPIPQLIQAIPTDGRRTAKEAAKAKAEAEVKEKEFKAAAEAESRAVAAEAKAAAEALAALEAEAKSVAAEEAKVAAAEVRAQARAQAAKESVSDLARSLESVGGFRPSAASLKNSVIPSFSSLVPNIPPPTPSSVAAAAQAAISRLKPETASSSGTTKQKRPLKLREPRAKVAPPEPKPVASPPSPPKKEKLLGGFLGEQETVFVDSELGDF